MIKILSVAVPARILTLVLTETAILFGCYFLAAAIDPDITEISTFVQFDAGLERITVAVLIIMLGLYLRNLYAPVRIPGRLELVQELVTVFGAAFIGQGLVHYVARDLTIPRKMMLIGSPLALGALLAWRLFFDAAARDARAAQRILFLGFSPAALELAAWLRIRPELGILPVGYLSGSAPAAQQSLPCLGTFEDLDDVIEREEPASLIIAGRDEVPLWSEGFLELDFGGIRIEELSSLYERIFGRIHISQTLPQRFIFTDAFEPDQTTSRLQAIYSPLLAALTLLALSPLILAVALLIRLTSSGPLLLREWRLGLRGVPFRTWRFRAEGAAGERLIRRFGLDALPQLVNVIHGTMSIVGPSPERPEFALELERAIPFYAQRNRVRPGLTGWEQVHRHYCAPGDILRRLEYDLYYVKNLAPSLDSAVLMLALKAKLL